MDSTAQEAAWVKMHKIHNKQEEKYLENYNYVTTFKEINLIQVCKLVSVVSLFVFCFYVTVYTKYVSCNMINECTHQYILIVCSLISHCVLSILLCVLMSPSTQNMYPIIWFICVLLSILSLCTVYLHNYGLKLLRSRSCCSRHFFRVQLFWEILLFCSFVLLLFSSSALFLLLLFSSCPILLFSPFPRLLFSSSPILLISSSHIFIFSSSPLYHF